jgi:hypothetical protein
MKDQYAGDINDYVKYSVLRALVEERGGASLVCWMLTANDTRPDGRKTSYLSDPDRYRMIDPDLFDSLNALVERGERTTAAIESVGILPDATFFRLQLEDGTPGRDRFFERLWSVVERRQLVFFDPDNGLDVPSVPRGRAGSRRYLYCSELAPLRDLDAAALIYQHFPRAPRAAFIATQLERLATALPNFCTFAIHSTHIALLVAAPCDQAPELAAGLRLARARWRGRLNLHADWPSVLALLRSA